MSDNYCGPHDDASHSKVLLRLVSPFPVSRCVPAEYLYATLANVVITLAAMFGIVVLLCTACTSVFQMCIQFCISLAVGSLTGDGLLHLLPMVGTAGKY